MATDEGDRPHILIVDDDENILTLLEMTLTAAAYPIERASNGAQALKNVDQRPPALIFLDMRMPIMDGWQFIQAYRQMPPPCAPIIILTASLEADLIMRQVGADGRLIKPFTAEEILAAVRQFMADA